jgi:hypothetical protein
MAASLSLGVSISSFHPPRRRRDGAGSGIEVAGGVKAHRQDREKGRLVWNRVVVTYVGSLQPFGPLVATISSEAHFVRPPAHHA